MKQKTAMEKLNIRSLPLPKHSIQDSNVSEASNKDTFSQNSAKGGDTRHKTSSVSPAEKDCQVKSVKSNSICSANAIDIKIKRGKRMSLESAFLDARLKARNSVFASSGSNILEGN